jgi:hypothetical protein
MGYDLKGGKYYLLIGILTLLLGMAGLFLNLLN